MARSRVEMRLMKPMRMERPVYDQYKFKAHPKWPKLSAWILKQLQKYGLLRSVLMEQVVEYHRISFDKNLAAKKIIELAHDSLILEPGFPRNTREILVGPKQMHELMADLPPWAFQPIQFDIEVRKTFRSSLDPYRREDIKVFNLPVSVIPWMDGVLVI